MRILRWSTAAALAAAVWATPAGASDGDLAAVKASMDNMKTEMAAMRAQMESERAELRARAGGAPEGLTTANGKAVIRIGGDFRIQYGISSANGWNRQGYTAYDENPHSAGGNTNVRSTRAGWDIARAKLTFDIDLSCDTKAYVSFRFDERVSYGNSRILDNAYWQWNNVGGGGFGIMIGLMDIPFGMWANTDMGGYAFSSTDRPLITYPFVRLARTDNFLLNGRQYWPLNDSDVVNLTNLALVTSYNWDDEVVLKAGIMASSWELPGQGFDSRLTYYNENRNLGFVDHVVTLGYNPCWLEGMHLEIGYMGRFDDGKGADLKEEGNPYATNYDAFHSGDHSYKPAFDLGVNYKINDFWRVWGEGVVTWNPFWGDGLSYALSVGVDYRLSERIKLGGGFDYFHANYAGAYYNDARPLWGNGPLYENLYRLSFGARYDFGNGLYLQAQYYHDMAYAAGIGDQDLKDADSLLFQTGFKF